MLRPEVAILQFLLEGCQFPDLCSKNLMFLGKDPVNLLAKCTRKNNNRKLTTARCQPPTDNLSGVVSVTVLLYCAVR
jgi:hypothetical protein